jgi:predicted amidohydrolase
MASDSLTVGLAQIAPIWLDRDATLAKVNSYVEQAASSVAAWSHSAKHWSQDIRSG